MNPLINEKTQVWFFQSVEFETFPIRNRNEIHRKPLNNCEMVKKLKISRGSFDIREMQNHNKCLFYNIFKENTFFIIYIRVSIRST